MSRSLIPKMGGYDLSFQRRALRAAAGAQGDCDNARDWVSFAVRRRVSHRKYRYADGCGTTVPVHGSRDIPPALVRKIGRDIGLTVEELFDRRR
jgi:predicted RNA binding protein YcfA (HicA-like mRNA interferase family)